jgi:enoyl-CoA hydratase/carnithine racemase
MTRSAKTRWRRGTAAEKEFSVTTTTYEQILFEQRERVGLITFNRPEKLNPWSGVMSHEVAEAIQRCNENDSVGAVVLTGAGRGYCSGADMSSARSSAEPASQGGTGQRRTSESGFGPENDPLPVFFRKSKPIVCAINGVAVGIGLTHALAADARIVSDRARLGAVFVHVGFTPELASTYFLPQITGLQNALEILLTGKIFDAQDALRLGFVNRVVPHESLLDEALAFAGAIAENPTWQVLQTKRMVYDHAVEQDVRKVLTTEDPLFAESSRSAARQEAIRAFTEKRQPNFHGVKQ